MNTKAKVNIFHDSKGQWYYALFLGPMFDHTDPLDVRTEVQAWDAVAKLFPDATIARVEDIR